MESITQSIYHVSKDNFVVLYKEARKALSYTNTHSGFAASGLVPLNPQRVLDKLTVKLCTQLTSWGFSIKTWEGWKMPRRCTNEYWLIIRRHLVYSPQPRDCDDSAPTDLTGTNWAWFVFLSLYSIIAGWT